MIELVMPEPESRKISTNIAQSSIQNRDFDMASIPGSEANGLRPADRILIKISEMANFCQYCLNNERVWLHWKGFT
jgi:hypothetical protein